MNGNDPMTGTDGKQGGNRRLGSWLLALRREMMSHVITKTNAQATSWLLVSNDKKPISNLSKEHGGDRCKIQKE